MILCLAFVQCAFADLGPGLAWQFYRKITLSAATPLANFQVKLTLTTGQYTNMNAGGTDIRFYDANNNICNYWIETFNNTGTSTIWVKVPASGTSSLLMFYGNAAATAVSNGANTFDFFDDFTDVNLTGWNKITTNGTNTVNTANGGTVTIANTSGGTNNGGAGIFTSFTPPSTSFVIEAKHRETAYNRIRYYALDATNPSGNGGSNSVIGLDYGFFITGTTPQIFWNAFTGIGVTANTDYLARWDITNGTNTPYTWSNFLFSTGAQVSTNTVNLTKTINSISFRVTEAANTSTIVDWARVRKAGATTPVGTAGAQLGNLSASITAQTNVACSGQATGSATVTPGGGASPFTYSWTTTPVQTTQTATNLAAGSYTVTVTDNNGLTATATATLAQGTTITTSVTNQTDPACFGTTSGIIVIAASGGSGSYSYSVDNGANYQPGNTFNVGAGIYKIRVKDSNGCESKPVQ
jgi:hypothetical protein